MRKTLLFITLFSLVAFAACGGGNNDGIPNLPNLPSGPGGGGGVKETLNATVKGKIAFEGTAPAPSSTRVSDPGCGVASVPSEAIVVSDGGLENVILFVSSDLAGKNFDAPSGAKVLDQMGCQYKPHALTVQVGQDLKITNSDPVAHNVHAWTEVNPTFNVAQAKKGEETIKKFSKEEMHFPIKCDVHNWMNSFVGVFNHPLHTVSKAGGAYEIKLPAGTYEITAVHEKLGTQKQMVTVAADGSADLNFSFKG
jgi:plastocyanin